MNKQFISIWKLQNSETQSVPLIFLESIRNKFSSIAIRDNIEFFKISSEDEFSIDDVFKSFKQWLSSIWNDWKMDFNITIFNSDIEEPQLDEQILIFKNEYDILKAFPAGKTWIATWFTNGKTFALEIQDTEKRDEPKKVLIRPKRKKSD